MTRLTIGQLLADAPGDVKKLLDQTMALFMDLNLPSPSLDADLDDVLCTIKACRMSITDATSKQRECTALSRLDDVYILLLRIQRMLEVTDTIGPLEGSPHNAYDFLITDIKPEDLPGKISQVMGIPYLSVVDLSPIWPAHGKVWGINRRCLFTLPVSLDSYAVNAHFLLDTGAPSSFLALSTVTALGLQSFQLSGVVVKLNGIRHPFRVSDEEGYTDLHGVWQQCHFKGLNILGMDFLDRMSGALSIDMSTQTVSMNKG